VCFGILQLPNLHAPDIHECDVSAVACGEVLLQDCSGSRKPIGYFLTRFSPAEFNYMTFEIDNMVIFLSLKFWAYFL
jgi:RNase H-like domain found in reverse transcriptase